MVTRTARYGLRGDNRMARIAQWQAMDGFFVGTESAYDAYESPVEDPASVTVRLHSVDWLDAADDRPLRTLDLGDTVLEVLGPDGHVLGDYALWQTQLTVEPGSSDATLRAGIDTLPHSGGEWVWDRRRDGAAGPGTWAGLVVGEREGWLDVARIVAFRSNRDYPVLPAHIALAGAHVEDLASFFCAVGEALAGPWGFCGASLAELADSLRFATRTVARPALVWQDWATAEKGLARTVEGTRYLDLARAVFADAAIDVTPA